MQEDLRASDDTASVEPLAFDLVALLALAHESLWKTNIFVSMIFQPPHRLIRCLDVPHPVPSVGFSISSYILMVVV